MANIVTQEEIDELGLSPANPALVDVGEPVIDRVSGAEGDGNEAAS